MHIPSRLAAMLAEILDEDAIHHPELVSNVVAELVFDQAKARGSDAKTHIQRLAQLVRFCGRAAGRRPSDIRDVVAFALLTNVGRAQALVPLAQVWSVAHRKHLRGCYQFSLRLARSALFLLENAPPQERERPKYHALLAVIRAALTHAEHGFTQARDSRSAIRVSTRFAKRLCYISHGIAELTSAEEDKRHAESLRAPLLDGSSANVAPPKANAQTPPRHAPTDRWPLDKTPMQVERKLFTSTKHPDSSPRETLLFFYFSFSRSRWICR